MITNVTEANGARIVIARAPSGRVRGAAVWESKREPGKFFALMRETACGDVSYQFSYKGGRIDFASEWATNHINGVDKARTLRRAVS